MRIQHNINLIMILILIYHAWRNTPAFRHGDISHTLFPRKQQ